jgi:hypothetical protein
MAAARQGFAAAEWLKHHGVRINRHRALALLFWHDLSENRCTLFRIMPAKMPFWQAFPRVKSPHKGRIPRRKGDVPVCRPLARCLPDLFA